MELKWPFRAALKWTKMAKLLCFRVSLLWYVGRIGEGRDLGKGTLCRTGNPWRGWQLKALCQQYFQYWEHKSFMGRRTCGSSVSNAIKIKGKTCFSDYRGKPPTDLKLPKMRTTFRGMTCMFPAVTFSMEGLCGSATLEHPEEPISQTSLWS